MVKSNKLSYEYWEEYYSLLHDKIGLKYKEELDRVNKEHDKGLLVLGEGEDIFDKVLVSFENQKIDLNADYSLTSLIGEGLGKYLTVLEYCVENGITDIVDIGIAHGFQSDIFINNNISYTGIELNVDEYLRNYKNGRANYIKGFYPNIEEELNINKDTTLGVAILSLGWGVYVRDDKELIYKQFKRLSEDFKHSLVYIDETILPIIEPIFDKVVKLKWNFYILIKD